MKISGAEIERIKVILILYSEIIWTDNKNIIYELCLLCTSVKVKECASYLWKSIGVSLAVWDHTVLPATRHKRTHPASTPARQAGILVQCFLVACTPISGYGIEQCYNRRRTLVPTESGARYA